MRYERSNIAAMTGYVPGEQPSSAGVVKLNTNENPFPPPRAVHDALSSVEPEQLRKYPPPDAKGFREAAAEAHGVGPENVLATNGGDELLRLAVTTFVEPGDPVGIAEPSYSLYPVLAAIHGSSVHRVPLEADWAPPEDLAERMNKTGVALTFLVNPHAPSGRLLGVERLASIATRLNGVLVVDEAYVDFVDPGVGYDPLRLVRDLDNVVLLRSMSKGYSLAGLRFGYGLGPASLIEPMATKTQDSYNTDAIAQTLATAALRARDEAARTWEAVRKERRRLREALADLGLESPASEANFLLAHVPEELGPAAAVQEALKARGVLVRHFDQPRLRDKLRITVGRQEENDALLAALRDLAAERPDPRA